MNNLVSIVGGPVPVDFVIQHKGQNKKITVHFRKISLADMGYFEKKWGVGVVEQSLSEGNLEVCMKVLALLLPKEDQLRIKETLRDPLMVYDSETDTEEELCPTIPEKLGFLFGGNTQLLIELFTQLRELPKDTKKKAVAPIKKR